MASNVLDEFLILFRTRLTGDGIQKVNKQLGQTKNQLFATRNLFKTFFAYDLYGAFSQLIPNLIETTQRLGAMESRFSAVTGQAKTGRQELAWIAEESQRLGLNFLETADNYSIFYATVRNTQGQATTRQIFQQWSEAFRVLHIDPARQGRILYALREMSSKGKIYMSDLAVQLGSAVPDAMQLAAKSMGYFGKEGVQKFRSDIKDGKVDVNQFLKSFSTMVNKTYVSADKLAFAMNKPDAQLQKLATNWQMLQIAFAEAGFEKDLVSTLKLMNSGLVLLSKNIKPLYNIIKGIGGIFVLSAFGKVTQFFLASLVFIKRISASSRGIFLLFRYLRMFVPWFRWLMAGFEGGGLVGALVVGITGLFFLILHNFFPNVEKALFNIWDIFKTDVKTFMLYIENWMHSLPMFQEYFKDMASSRNGPTRGDVVSEQWKKIFPNNAFMAKTMSNLDRAVMPATYNNNVKINTNVTVDGSNSTPQEIAEAIAEKQNESAIIKTGRKIKDVIHHFIK